MAYYLAIYYWQKREIHGTDAPWEMTRWGPPLPVILPITKLGSLRLKAVLGIMSASPGYGMDRVSLEAIGSWTECLTGR